MKTALVASEEAELFWFYISLGLLNVCSSLQFVYRVILKCRVQLNP